MAEDITKLGYVRANPKLAFARVNQGSGASDIYKTQGGDEWVVAPNFYITFDGINWGDSQPLPGPGGLSSRPAIVANYAFDDGGGRRLYIGGDVTSQNPKAVGPDPHWSGDYPIYACLMKGDIKINGETVASNIRGIWLVEGWSGMGGDGDDIKQIRDLIDLGVVTPFPEMEIIISEIRAIFRMFDNVDGFQEEKGGASIVYSHDWATEPGDDWSNAFEGSGFGIDVLGGMKASHANPGYTLGGNGFAGSFARRQIEAGGGTGYEQVNKTYVSSDPSHMLDLRINDANAVRAGGKLRIGYNADVVLEIVGGNNYYGYDYGTGSEDLSQLKTQLVNILNAAMQAGNPLNGILTMASPSSDNLPDYVQIHLEASNPSVWVESGDSIAQRPWTFEFDYDVSNSVSLYTKAGGPPACPMLVVQAINFEGLAGGPLLDGLCVGFLIAKGNDGNDAYGFTPGGDGPATIAYSAPDAGRVKIEHDGNDNYTWSISTNGGVSWTVMFTASNALPDGWQNSNRRLRFGMTTFGLGNTPDGRINNVILSEPGSSYMADAFRPLQNGDHGWGYLIDRLGFRREEKDYKLIWGVPPDITILDGSLGAGPREGGGEPRIYLQPQGHATEAYYIDGGSHSIGERMVTGEYDVWALLFDFEIEGEQYHDLILADDSIKADVISQFEGYGGVLADSFKVWSKNGINADYTWIGPGGIGSDADTRYAARRDQFTDGATDESWNRELPEEIERVTTSDGTQPFVDWGEPDRATPSIGDEIKADPILNSDEDKL